MSTTPQGEPGVPVCYRHPGRESYIRCQRCDRPICPDCMRDAAVGFQCPDCVATGQRETRSGRTTYGGRPPANAALTSWVLIGINALVFVAVSLTGRYASPLYAALGLRANGSCVEGDSYYPRIPDAAICEQFTQGSWAPGVVDGAYWQLLTSGFLHVDPLHLLFNCFFIYMIGPQLEIAFGRLRFLGIFLVSLLVGAVTVYWLAGASDTTLGASGAAYGMMAALLVVVLRRGLDPRQLLVLIAVNVAFTFFVPGISWQGHLGGFLGGALAAAALVFAPSGPQRARYQALGIAGLVLVCAALVVARTLALS